MNYSNENSQKMWDLMALLNDSEYNIIIIYDTQSTTKADVLPINLSSSIGLVMARELHILENQNQIEMY